MEGEICILLRGGGMHVTPLHRSVGSQEGTSGVDLLVRLPLQVLKSQKGLRSPGPLWEGDLIHQRDGYSGGIWKEFGPDPR